MYKDVINNYVWNILKKQLQKFKISNKALYKIIDNIETQLKSIIYNWNDIEFRDAILIIGSEEGSFYEPRNELIANMVVVAIRNSLLEGVSSKSYKEYGSINYLNDSSVKIITSAAIEYFSKFNLQEVSNNTVIQDDIYRKIVNKYPVAFNALKELSKCTINNLEHEYQKINYVYPYNLMELENYIEKEGTIINTESGIDEKFNNSLLSFLNDIKNNKSKIFVTDSFKMITRNFEKLLKIIEFILTHDGIFITCNYLIANDYVSRRTELLKASHSDKDFFDKIVQLPEVSKKYEEVLKQLL